MRRLTLITLALFATAAPLAHAGTLGDFHAAQDSLQRGVNQARAELILDARGAFEALAAADEKSAWLPYWVALCDWRATPLLQRGTNLKLAAQVCDHGLAAVTRALKLDPKNAEAIALEAGLLGMSLSFKDNSAAMTIGPQMEGLYGQARGLAPNSPRVAFLDALNTMHKPTFFGGGTDKAMPKFVQAIALFDSSATSGGMAPNWGRDDANLWAGRAAAKLGDNTRARRYYDAALTANPDNAWVRNSLIPALTAAPAPSAKGKTGK